MCNLVSCPDSQLAAVEAGAVPCLRQLAKLGVPEIEVSFNNIATRDTILNDFQNCLPCSVSEELYIFAIFFLYQVGRGVHHMPPHKAQNTY